MSKTSKLMKKVSIALTSGIVISSLTGCGSEPEFVETTNDPQGYYESSQTNNEDTNQINEIDEGTTSEDSINDADYTDTDYDDETEYAYTDAKNT